MKRVWMLVFVTVAACSSNDSLPGTLECDANGACPKGFMCNKMDNLCVVMAGTVDAGPDARVVDATPAPDVPVPDATPPPDATPLETTITAKPPALGNVKTVSFSFTANVAGATFECRLGMVDFAPCTSPHPETLADGSYLFEVRSVFDGMRDGSPAQAMFVIDTTPPDTTITSGPSGTVHETTVSFVFTATEVGSSFQCKLDGTSLTSCASGASFDGGCGSHTFSVFATDPAGNADATPATQTWTVDDTADTVIDSAPPAQTPSSTAVITFHGSGAAFFECSLDGSPFARCTSPFQVDNLAQGAHAFLVRSVAPCGGVDATPAQAGWTVDVGPITATITGGAENGISCSTVTFLYSAPDQGATFECSFEGSGFAPCPVTGITFGGLMPGATYTFAVRAVDAQGNVGPAIVRQFTVDGGPPTVTLTSPVGGSTTGPNPVLHFSTEAGATVTCALDGSPIENCTDGMTLPDLSGGSHTVTVTATDACDNAGAASAMWVVDATPPAVSISQPASGSTVGTNGAFLYSVGDSTTVTCSLDGASLACDRSGMLNFTLPDGPHSFAVTGTDASGNSATATTSFTVQGDMDAPMVESVQVVQQDCFGDTPHVSFSFQLSDASNITEIHCVLDGADTVCGSGTSGTVDYPGSPGGPNGGCHCGSTFGVYGVDQFMNSGVNSPSQITVPNGPCG